LLTTRPYRAATPGAFRDGSAQPGWPPGRQAARPRASARLHQTQRRAGLVSPRGAQLQPAV